MARSRPLVTVRRMVRNQSSRNGHVPRIIVIHDTESHNRPGDADLAAIGAFFDIAAVQASSHVCTDGDGHSARYVADENKAWHCVTFNSIALGIEQIGEAAQRTWASLEVRETARWCARWSIKFGIPLKRSTSFGVCTHADLGAAGGGHHDPGTNYPMAALLTWARLYRWRIRHRTG